MKNIKVLGTGCAKCQTTLQLIADIAQTNQSQINLEKVEDMAQIVGYGVMSTPAVIIDDTIVHVGSVPDKSAIEGWLAGDELAGDVEANDTQVSQSDSCCSTQSSDDSCCAPKMEKDSCCSSSS